MLLRIIDLDQVHPFNRVIELEEMEKPARIIRRDFVRTKGAHRKVVYTKLCPYCNADFKTSREHTQYCQDCRLPRHRELLKLRRRVSETIYAALIVALFSYNHFNVELKAKEARDSSEG